MKKDVNAQPDEDTKELRRVAKKMSRDTGIPVDSLMLSIGMLVAREQVRHEILVEADEASGKDKQKANRVRR